MDAIKKKMQAMKLEKDNAMDKADTLEQQNKETNLRAEKVEDFHYILLCRLYRLFPKYFLRNTIRKATILNYSDAAFYNL